MVKKSLCLALAALLVLLMCSCSFIDSAMEEAGLDPDLRDKINTAWDEVAKEGIKTVIDDAWREYGLGRSLEWPGKGNGALIPKLRDGSTEFAYRSKDGAYGCICVSGVSKSKLAEYKKNLAELGFVETVAACSVSELYSCDGLIVGFTEYEGDLLICYGNSAEEIEAAHAAAENGENAAES
ncbi:MAG: hypothetical protein J6U75_07435 [Clostridia bacterium]|nr:hypothetical protein [Clostridia bacterium]